MQPSLVVIGSSNTDMVIQAMRIPVPGETILGGNFFMNPGGKGANQAVAAARLGGKVTFICKTGNDLFGAKAIELFRSEGIDTRFIVEDKDHPSGVALITVNQDGENSIVVASGANGWLKPDDIKQAEAIIRSARYILVQLEIPLDTVAYIADLATHYNVKLILNPAPACAVSNELLRRVSIITPNESEAELLTGVTIHSTPSAEEAARSLQAKGIETVIITRGEAGALLLHKNIITHVPAVKVKAVDTTSAGDVFNGALMVALSEGKAMEEAVSFACTASAIAVTRLGAQSSAPYRNELSN
ncbi:MAG: ribokinase [Cyclobacteriaceae bacterium]|nr:ribokinase [Cyclobacteriaceae bacterium]